MKIYPIITALFFSVTLFYGCGEEQGDRDVDIIPAEEKTADEAREEPLASANTVFGRLGEDQNFRRFSEEIEAAGLDDEMRSEEGPVTVFAPSNAAYSNDTSSMADSDTSSAARQNLIEYYMVDGELTADFLRREVEKAGGQYPLKTRQGENIMVILENDEIVLLDAHGNKARIEDESIRTDNGMVYAIDEVLQPKNQAVVAENEIEVNSKD